MLLLKVEDTELFNTFDDIFIEQFDIVDYTHATEFVNGLAVYTIYFPKGVDKNRLLKAVKSIDEAEVERIFKGSL